jgi:alpha-L-fucosidase
MNRRQFLHTPLAAAPAVASLSFAQSQETGAQRLSLPALRGWEALGFGMFIHFGMSTYDGDELSRGDKPSTHYNPCP